MHKIRLYVVPEVREDEKLGKINEDVVIDEVDDSPIELHPAMQRRNSRRPNSGGGNGFGTVRLNVIQKDRKIDSIAPKLKQIAQLKLAKNDNVQNNKESVIVFPKDTRNKKIFLNDENRLKILDNNNLKMNFNNNNNNTIIKKSNNDNYLVIKNKNGVFASPKIQELAVNLQEKMIERNSKFMQHDRHLLSNSISSNVEDVTPRKMIRNDKKTSLIETSCSLDPIFEQTNDHHSSSSCNDHRSSILSIENDIDDDDKISEDNNVDFKNNNNYYYNNYLTNFQNNTIKVPAAGNKCNSTAAPAAVAVILRRNNNKLNRYREYDLEQKIEVEIKMREGSARLLAAARHRAQSLEAARALLTSNERMSAYMAELQRRKKEPTSNKPSLPVSNARVSLSDLRVPLMWRDSDHFKNRGDYRRFAVFCLARVGTEIHDTALLCPVDRALTDVTFPDVLVFNNVPAEFEVTLEIYSHILQEDLSIASTPRRIKRSIHSSISRTVGKKLAASLRDELNSGKIGPHFELMASARLTLDDTDDNIHTHDLVLNNLENKNHSLPLFGHFCCRLAAQPECVTKEACSGNVILDGRTCWARIQGFTLQAWDSRKLADEEQSPFSTVPINRETLIQPSKSSSKELRISNTIEGSDKITTIRLETSEEAQKWVRQLVAHAKDHLRWRHAAETIQDVPSVESARNSFISNKRQGSLYDETPLIESVQSDFNTATRPTVQQIFGLTPSTSLSSCSSTSSPPSLRSRSLSTSGSRKSGTNTLRSHWPFSNKNHE